ncbi:hypothetical protein M501DRAFT_1011372 [Patellaria atrata CBS 101060]|uniref:Tr-type G domain-containing protein n=1 Tax=Patellaria atrata CBS 101060 TaxID=1346257 RepID=A0A9P4S9K7_9PEZI|nr:hypothetical protein M501DRAFT_1011372 [Patellaria atrata CBS 101060]
MASIFTFDPDPPRVASPWLTSRTSTPCTRTPTQHPPNIRDDGLSTFSRLIAVEGETFSENVITRLEAEPQEGPTEYKLHLLLRPRRSFCSSSTNHHTTGSYKAKPSGLVVRRSSTETTVSTPPPPAPASSSSSSSSSSSTPLRQHRLVQLTTQLLWRLQQSSPYHASTAKDMVLPLLPEATEQLHVPPALSKLVPGLEESKGALYEIGVADDGTCIGLVEEELEESLNNLRAMAASLGCTVDVLRKVPVGTCEWIEQTTYPSKAGSIVRSGTLWVAEAYVKPYTGGDINLSVLRQLDVDVPNLESFGISLPNSYRSTSHAEDVYPPTPQLRVSLSGATASGKSSLLGCLTTATLDNGRGKSRINLLKHRHEIASGLTSSVTQELIGYSKTSDNDHEVEVVNYASGNVSSWNDIHAASKSGRLILLSDSAGHPRYRRTTVRGLVGWAPHWTLLCLPADNAEDTSGKNGSTPSSEEILGPAAAEVDLSQAHLELCLALELPLVVVITKLDLASKNGLRQTLSKVLTMLKNSGRKPAMFSGPGSLVSEANPKTISASDLSDFRTKTRGLEHDILGTVPIILTSALSGDGIRKLHAILHELPIPDRPSASDTTPTASSTVFHIEDVYNTLRPHPSSSSSSSPLLPGSTTETPTVLSGHLSKGELHTGDELLLGPYASPSSTLVSSQPRSYPGATASNMAASSRSQQREWRRVRVVSIRNLRLPVRVLRAGQVGSVGVVPVHASDGPLVSPALPRIRKGMVLADGAPRAWKAFVARFEAPEVRAVWVGSGVLVYVASVRASAKVVVVAQRDLSLSARNSPLPPPAPSPPQPLPAAKSNNSEDQVPIDLSLLALTHYLKILFELCFLKLLMCL